MLTALTFLAGVLYVAPLLGLVALLRAARDGALELACALSLAFSCDLLGTFALTHAMTLERVAFVRTALLLGVAALVITRRVRNREPVLRARGALTSRDLVAGSAAAALGFVLSYSASSAYWIWDREWHVPFTASLRAQRMPIVNVYEPGLTLRYHLVGDLSASVLQALSFDAMSAIRALALAHDLQLALLAGVLGLLFRALCDWPAPSAALAALLPPLAGPIALRYHPAGGRGDFEGYADFSNLALSFRPHCMVALVLIGGVLCQVARLSRAERDAAPSVASVAPLAVSFMLLGIADEISGAVLGIALGGVWLLEPRWFGTRRWHGAAWLAGFAALALLGNLLLAGTIAPGGPIHHASWVRPRLPRFFADPLVLGTHKEAWREAAIDLGPIVVPLLVVAWSLLQGRGREDTKRVPKLVALFTAPLCLVLFLCFEVNGRTFEGHRFLTAARIVTPVVALLVVGVRPRAWLASTLVLIPILAGAFATLGYFYSALPALGDEVAQRESQYDANCRAEYGAHFGESLEPTWIDESLWYEYAGCHPIYAAPGGSPDGDVVVGWPAVGQEAWTTMNRSFFAPHTAARVVCPSKHKKLTPFCKKAESIGACEPAGTLATLCLIPPKRRGKLNRL